MVIDEIELTNFRNFKKFCVNPDPKMNVLSGRNGIGKTNFLESIYYITHLKSFRTSSVKYLLFEGKESIASIAAKLNYRSSDHSIFTSFHKEGRSVFQNEKPVRYTSEYLSDLYSILISTDLIIDFKINRKTKRKLLDRFCYRAYPTKIREFKEQKTIRENKNRLIRMKRNSEVDLWNRMLHENSEKIFDLRIGLVNEINQFLADYYRFLTGKKQTLRLCYKSNLNHEEKNREQIVQSLCEKVPQEIAQGFGLNGPHRDQFWFELDSKKEAYGFSQGEYKSSFISLQLCFNQILKEKDQEMPILLIDDVFSEIDETTSMKLFEFLEESSNQVFLTTSFDRKIPAASYKKIDVQSGSEVKEQ